MVLDSWSQNHSWLSGFDNVLYPPFEFAEVGVDAWKSRSATGRDSPGHKALKDPIADYGASRVSLLREEKSKLGRAERGMKGDDAERQK